MKFTMTEETRVGFKATSILEEMCVDYLRTHTTNGKFTGDWGYCVVYGSLRRYNMEKSTQSSQ